MNNPGKKSKIKTRLFVLEIGSPILTDDSVGLRVVEVIRLMKPELEIAQVKESGIGLLDLVAGYDKLVIIGSIKTGKTSPGHLYRLNLEDLKPSSNLYSSHGADIASTIYCENILKI